MRYVVMSVVSCGSDGLIVASCGSDGLIVASCGSDGLIVASCGSDGLIVASCGSDGLIVASWGSDGLIRDVMWIRWFLVAFVVCSPRIASQYENQVKQIKSQKIRSTEGLMHVKSVVALIWGKVRR
ncbi:hypothetical protein TNCV_4510591 [Trichonephila clavipes]|nr:hypothetical protein TNCV_4510591 [Trichonephila clavipes]